LTIFLLFHKDLIWTDVDWLYCEDIRPPTPNIFQS